ncbi:MAG: hypothetical protein GX442_15370 [Candidatus Riflebacteria bacterium]|nr:hypothetical protein [Candidatus Riflebacteria bacterium]
MEQLSRMIAVLKQNEELFAALYREGGRLFPALAEEFERIAREEESHASLFAGIQSDLAAHPDRWRQGRITLETCEGMQMRIKAVLEEVRQGKVAPRFLLTSLASLEQSMVERSLHKIIETDEPRLADALRHISQGFTEHFRRLQDLEARLFPPTQPPLF